VSDWCRVLLALALSVTFGCTPEVDRGFRDMSDRARATVEAEARRQTDQLADTARRAANDAAESARRTADDAAEDARQAAQDAITRIADWVSDHMQLW
jgi:hypothetical protein